MTQQESGERIAPVTYLFGGAGAAAPAVPELVEPDEIAKRVEPVETHTPGVSAGSTSRRRENVSMNALTRRGLSVEEMGDLLAARDIDPEDAELEVERLIRVGLLDDFALAETLVRTLHERKGLGRSAITAELRRRKVDDSAIEEALEAIDDGDELTRAIEVATKRASQLSSYDPATAKRRLGAYLQRRGYSGSVLSAAMTAALSARDSGGVRFR